MFIDNDCENESPEFPVKCKQGTTHFHRKKEKEGRLISKVINEPCVVVNKLLKTSRGLFAPTGYQPTLRYTFLKVCSMQGRKRRISERGMEANSDNDWREERTARQCLEHLYLSEHLADVTFTFASQPSVKLPAHKFVLSMRSNVFEAMFYGSMAENSNTIRLDDIDADIMKLLLRYVYTDETSLDGDRVWHCLYAAKKYNLGGLEKLCSNYLKNIIGYGNVCTIHEQAVFFAMKELQMQCFDYIHENAQPVLASSDFENLSQQTLLRLLSSNELEIAEEEIFKSSIRWAKQHCSVDGIESTAENTRTSLGEALYQIRFPLLDIGFFATFVTPAGILQNEEQIMLYQNLATNGSTELKKFIKDERIGKLLVIDTRQFSSREKNGNGYFF